MVRRAADVVMSTLASLLTRVFFRHIEIEGAERLPRAGPAVLVANHTNGLVDALLLMTTLRPFPRFLAKSTLWRIAPLRPFLWLAGAVPVYRPADGGNTSGNDATFRTCRQLLARGGVIAVFPEGISHNEPALQPLRTGAARIALGAADQGTAGVVTVAVGLVYDAKARFRSRALIRVGLPQPVDAWLEAYRTDDHATVRAFTEDLARQLRTVVATYRSWQEAQLLNGVADLVVAQDAGSRRNTSRGWDTGAASSNGSRDERATALADRERVVASLTTVDLDGTDAGRALQVAYRTYQRDLALLGLTDAQITASYGGSYRRAVGWSLLKIVLALPVGLIGAIIHVVPYRFMKWVGSKPANESIRSTVKVGGCFTAFNLTYVALSEAVRRRWSAKAAVAAFLAAPVSGYVTLRLSERIKSVGGLVEGATTVRSRQMVLPMVLAHRADVVRLAIEAGHTSPERV